MPDVPSPSDASPGPAAPSCTRREAAGDERRTTDVATLFLRQQSILESIARDAPLTETLDALVSLIEEEFPGTIGSFLLLGADGERLHVASARGLPAPYNDAIEGVRIGPSVGSCGTAAFRGEPVFVSDIATDPLWERYREVALAHGLRACWSMPIRSRAGTRPVLGTFAVYSRRAGMPDPRLRELVEWIEHLACIAIERRRSEEQLRRRLFDLTVLNDVGRICAEAGTTDEILGQTTRLVADSLFPDNCGFLLLDAERQVLIPHRSFVLTDPAVVSAEIPLRSGITGKAVRTGHAQRVDDVRLDADYLAADGRTRSELCLPVRVGERVAGALNIESSAPGAFSEADERLMTAVADLVGNALDRFRSREKLRAGETLYRTMLESLPIGVFVHDGRRMYYANPAARQIMGVSSVEQMLRMSPFDVVAPEHREMARRRVETILATGERLPPVEARVVRLDGSVRDVEVSSIRTRFEDHDCVQVHFADITDIRRLERQVRQSQKMEALGRVAGGVAHDFNNLLTVINGCGELLIDSVPSGDPRRAHLAAIRDAGERAAALTAQLLAFSRRAVVATRVLDLNALVESSARLLLRLIGERIELVVRTDPALVRIKADPGQVEQVIMNLAVNARDAMPSGGRLTIETRNVAVGRSDAPRHPGPRAGLHACLRVSDTGHGMTDDVKGRVFEPFFTTKGIGKGTGLGLAVVHGVIAQCGGHVNVESAVGVGTTFELLIPQTDESAAEAPDDAARPPAPAPATETVLLVEDDSAVRTFVRLGLRTLGYQILEADCGTEALRLVDEHQGPIHLLLTDVVMPGMGGPQLAEAVRARRPEVRVLLMSGHIDDRATSPDAANAGIGFLQKPFTMLALARKAREALEGAE